MHFTAKKKTLRAGLTVLATAGLLLAAGCASTEDAVEDAPVEETTTETSEPAGESYSFDFTMITGENDTVSIVNQRFIDEVAALSDGRIQMTPHFGGSLFGPLETLDAFESGAVEIGLQTSSFASGAIPDLAVLEVPYGTPADPDTVREFHAEANPIVEKIYAEKNQKVVFSNPGIFPGGILCNEPLDADVDFSGKLIRTAGPWQGAVMEAWGATPVTLGVAELYTALQTGTVDCALQVYNLMDSLKLAEVAPYIYRLDFGVNYNTVNMNLDVWESLSEADQQILLEAGATAQEYAIELLKSGGDALMESLVASGGEFCVPTTAILQDKVDRALTVRPAMADAATTEAGRELIALSDSYQDRVVVAPSYGPTDPCS